MSYIYKPTGKAFEYCELALNLYSGCSGKCSYCYVPSALHVSRETFQENIRAREFDFSQLIKEMEKNRGKSVFLCFSTDPYNHLDSELKITRQIIEMFSRYEIAPIILTKAGMRSTRDFDLLARIPGAKYGATLTFINPEDSLKWEPGAALPQERMDALRQAHELGIRTWVSLEPVIEPEQSLELIRQAHGFIHEFKLGKWNHDQRANLIDWRGFLREAVTELKKAGKPYLIKRDLAKYL